MSNIKASNPTEAVRSRVRGRYNDGEKSYDMTEQHRKALKDESRAARDPRGLWAEWAMSEFGIVAGQGWPAAEIVEQIMKHDKNKPRLEMLYWLKLRRTDMLWALKIVYQWVVQTAGRFEGNEFADHYVSRAQAALAAVKNGEAGNLSDKDLTQKFWEAYGCAYWVRRWEQNGEVDI
ncbi:uncharacterized protein LTR77_004449 [Saxophila tyrrhenica]|uniref:Uncharacterized protein n=1 Tax=Saxophila tyrrhenica TaxID=1690608 RepID=A0AAV9PH48_9PEZI|nr:hypothetical protein LTR77_004449 [Saxophila tyrrhenica]